jgi:hypothetical protein
MHEKLKALLVFGSAILFVCLIGVFLVWTSPVEAQRGSNTINAEVTATG